eukprot:6741745-Pyramimonas_sp.AAC.1
MWGVGGALSEMCADNNKHLDVAARVRDVVQAARLALEGEWVPAHEGERLGGAVLGRGVLAVVGIVLGAWASGTSGFADGLADANSSWIAC